MLTEDERGRLAEAGRLIDSAESSVCPCGHIALDHAWHGCEECSCGRSAVAAYIHSQPAATPAPTEPPDVDGERAAGEGA